MNKNQIQIEFDLKTRMTGLSKVIRNACSKALALEIPEKQYSVSILICDDERIRDLNRTYRDIDNSTDVLSFEDTYELPGSNISHLGDIAISYPTALRQSLAAGHSIESELSLLVIHGILHLLGFDHITETEKEQMWALQKKCLDELGLELKSISGDSDNA